MILFFTKKGFLEAEIKKEQLPLPDPEENLDAPKAREMIDLEVRIDFSSLINIV